MFWFFLSVFIVIDSTLFYKGYNTYLWRYKTDLEKQVQLDRLGFEKATVKSDVTEVDINKMAEKIAVEFSNQTKTISTASADFATLKDIIKEELKSS